MTPYMFLQWNHKQCFAHRIIPGLHLMFKDVLCRMFAHQNPICGSYMDFGDIRASSTGENDPVMGTAGTTINARAQGLTRFLRANVHTCRLLS